MHWNTDLDIQSMPSFSYHYVSVPVVDMRAEASLRSEVVSQALFSELIRPLKTLGEWTQIETLIDQYRGWIPTKSFCQADTKFCNDSHEGVAFVNRSAAHLYAQEDIVYGPLLTLPYESRLKIIDPLEPSDRRWIKVELPDRRRAFIQRGDVVRNPKLCTLQTICELSLKFLGLPYTWGGRSSFGYDCSGFVQMLYRQMGVYLPRDSKDQFHWNGFKEIGPKEIAPGDLIFYGVGEDKIRHVGMSLGKGNFIHASAVVENAPYIRISNITDREWNGSGLYKFCSARTIYINI